MSYKYNVLGRWYISRIYMDLDTINQTLCFFIQLVYVFLNNILQPYWMRFGWGQATNQQSAVHELWIRRVQAMKADLSCDWTHTQTVSGTGRTDSSERKQRWINVSCNVKRVQADRDTPSVPPSGAKWPTRHQTTPTNPMRARISQQQENCPFAVSPLPFKQTESYAKWR